MQRKTIQINNNNNNNKLSNKKKHYNVLSPKYNSIRYHLAREEDQTNREVENAEWQRNELSR